MKRTESKWLIAALAWIAGTFTLVAEPTLKVGDKAPKLQTGKWVQGDPVDTFKPGKAYIVEFWATWCGPCRVSIPHLNEIHNKFKDQGLIVIGQDCWERDDKLVGPFVEKMGEKMTYRVALDDKSDNDKGKMAETWMAAAGRNGIPSAFLVDTKGTVAWIGHPMELKEQTIEAVLKGDFDVKKAASEYAQKEQTETQMRSIWGAISRAMQRKDWDTAAAKVVEAEKILPAEERDNLDMVRMDIALGKKDSDTAYKLAAKVSQGHLDNPLLQNQLAWRMLTDDAFEPRDLNLAEKIANRANDAAKGKDAGILDTLARAKFMLGKKEEALALQNKALSLADADQKDEIQKVLDSYKKGELPKSE